MFWFIVSVGIYFIEDQFCNVELKLTAGSTVRRKELPVSDDAPIKNIDFVLLEDRDLTSSRVTLNTVIPDPVKAIPKPSVTDNTNGEVVVMPDLSQIKEPFLLEPHQQLGSAMRVECFHKAAIHHVFVCVCCTHRHTHTHARAHAHRHTHVRTHTHIYNYACKRFTCCVNFIVVLMSMSLLVLIG